MKLKLFWINRSMGQNVTKSNTGFSILRALVPEVLYIFYPELERLRIFTDGFLLSDSPNVGARDVSKLFSVYVPVSRGTQFDGEIAEIRTSLSHHQRPLEKFRRAVILSDSRAALCGLLLLRTIP
ncbi:hypothetical protein TNCV_147471 [Trichonephila clavipes]|nr:hypothetical protein TNCV_147471 [Trichonephila clavipes]